MKKITKILLAVLSGLLLSPAYFQWGTGFIMFFAMIPILLVEQEHFLHKEKNKTKHLFWYPFITFFIFNLLTIWWVKNSHWMGAIVGVPLNTIVMTLPFLAFHYIKRSLGPRLGYISLVVLWIAAEYLYLNVQVNFPWVLLGNAFANDVAFIQWYEVTGTFGGSAWILIMNVLLVQLIIGLRKQSSFSANRSKVSWIIAFLIVPIAVSLVRFYTYEEEKNPYECVVLQPNIDPYQKFLEIPQAEQTDYLLDLAREAVTDETDYIIAPETFISNGVWHSMIEHQIDILKIEGFLEKYPDASMVIGAMTYKRYAPGDSIPNSAKPLGTSGDYYDSFNTAIQLDRTGEIPMYHKSRLVTGAEWMPSFKRFKKLQEYAVDLGGITRSHGVQKERETFVSPDNKVKVGPVICWESIFGEYVTKYVKDAGANLIFIITNDGWWKETPGHRQHNSFAHLRAIETRRSIARSANTGISCLIDQRGVETARTKWWERTSISGTLNANSHLTFYTKHGDYIARISGFFSVLLILYAFVSRRSSKESKPASNKKRKK